MSFLALLRREPRVLGFGLVHTAASSVGQTFVIALFLPGIKVSFALDDAQVASLYGLATVASAGVLWWLGRWIDKVDVVHYSIASGLFLAFACALTASATTVAVLAAGLFCLRLGGQGLLTHIAVTATARYFREARGKALSLTSMGHSLGEAALPAILVLLIGVWGWRATYVLAGVLALLSVLAAAVLVRRNPEFRHPQKAGGPILSSAQGHARAEPRPHFLRSRYFLMSSALFIAPPLVITALVFHQAVIAEDKGYTLQWFAVSFIAFALSRVAASLLIGPVVDRYGSTLLFALHLLPLSAAIALLVALSPEWVVPLYWILAGISSGASGTLQAAMVAEHVPGNKLGGVRGILASMMILASAAGPALYGWLLAAGISISAILWGTAVAMIGATVLGIAAQPGRPGALAKGRS